jgi:cytochrome P450
MAELIKNPNEMDKAQAEVRQVVAGGAPSGVVLEEQLGAMRRLQAAMKEAMRLHPTVPLPREAIRDTRLHGYDVRAKTRVVVNAWAIGRDGEAWEHADKFRPEKFLLDDTTTEMVDYSGPRTSGSFRSAPGGGGALAPPSRRASRSLYWPPCCTVSTGSCRTVKTWSRFELWSPAGCRLDLSPL